MYNREVFHGSFNDIFLNYSIEKTFFDVLLSVITILIILFYFLQITIK